MASQGEMEANVEQEREIPVFTVTKNNAILKNIFLINSGSSISETRRQDSSKKCDDLEQTLLVGRHPDSDIRLEHPSVSRFHLRIHSKPSSKLLSVTDLSSVHGTWISGKRIEPYNRVDINEGDALKIGGSSRVYRLHWIPFSKAYDSNNPFIPLLDDVMEEEIQTDENALVLENEVQSVNSTSPKDLLSNQFETLEEIEEHVGIMDVSTVQCKNEDEKSSLLGCEFSLDSALEAIKAFVSNQSEASTESENENTPVCKNEEETPVDSPIEDLPFSQEEEVLSLAPSPEAMEALDMPLESRDMQFVKFAWEGSETLLLDRSPLLAALEENKPSHAMQEVNYSHDMVVKNEESRLELELEDNMSISGDMEEVGEKEGNVSGSSTGPSRELAVEQETENQEVESPRELLFSKESSPTEIQWESPIGSALTSNLMENLDDSIISEFADEFQWEYSSGPALTSNLMENLDDENEMLERNEYLMPPCDDEELGAAWSFWSQGLEDENARQVRNSLVEDPVSGEIQSLLWSFWSGIPVAESVHLSSLSDAELFQVETQSTNYSPSIHSMETLDSGPSEEMFPDRAASSVWLKRGQSATSLEVQTNRTLQEKVDNSSGVNNEAWILNDERYSPIKRALFIDTDTVKDHLDEEYFTPAEDNCTWSPTLEKPQLSSATTEACIDSEESLSAYSNKENVTPKSSRGWKSDRRPLEEHAKPSRLTKKETQRTPMRTLFTDSPQKSVSEARKSGASLSAYSNKENETPKAIQEQKTMRNSSVKGMKLFMAPKGEEQRTALQTLLPDSPQKSTSEAHISGASLSAYSNKENQTPKTLQKQKSSRYSSVKCLKLSIPSKGEDQRTPLRSLFSDSPQESTSKTRTSCGSSGSAWSNKENQPHKFDHEQKSARCPSAGHTQFLTLRKQEAEMMMPSQTLFGDSPQKNISDTCISCVSPRGRDSTTYENSIDKNKHSKQQVKRWTMLVDVASLLNKTSRKALQLLEGTKGTQIIIPRTVLKELDAMKQQTSFFKRNTEAYLASQWIEECIVRTKCWIQIQSCMADDGRSTPLPGSNSHCAYGTLPENVYPSTEDQVLDYALYSKRIQNDGQLVLLSDDPTLKIKAMAEGLICETAEEFQESLVNPFSKRFLWVDSLPRGRTWSYLDDVILRKNHYPGAMKGVENAKGLKLIPLLAP